MGATKYVYDFSEGNASMKSAAGRQGGQPRGDDPDRHPGSPGLHRHHPGLRLLLRQRRSIPTGSRHEINEHLKALEKLTGKTLGDPKNPLLLSIRSGAVFSMPGMMDTVLNLGLNDETVDGLATGTGNKRFAYDSYRRFISMFGDVVMGVDPQVFEEELWPRSGTKWAPSSTPTSPPTTSRTCATGSRRCLQKSAGESFPHDPMKQLHLAIVAVFKSWDNHRAKVYRRTQGIPDDLGTAVNVQSMVFGNKGETSGTGVAFTRDPSTGENLFYGEFLMNAQGEDVVAGVREPRPLPEMEQVQPENLKKLYDIRETLEKHYRDMQDLEFTIEDEKLYMLQTRNGKRTAPAALRMAVDMVAEGLITKDEALMRVDPASSTSCCTRASIPRQELNVLATGLGASPGAGVGKAVFDADDAEEKGSKGEPVILVRWETNPDDIHGLMHSQGVITSHGGMTSHAAVVARGMGKPCIAGVPGHEGRREGQAVHHRRRGHQRRRLDLHGRRHRPGDPGQGRTRGRRHRRERQHGARLGRRRAPPESAHQRRHARRRTPPPVASAPRASACAAPSTCSCSRSGCPHVQAMIMADTTEEREEHLAKLLPVPARGLRRHLPGHGRPAGDHPPARPAAPRVPAELRGHHAGTAAAAAHRRSGGRDRQAGDAGRQGEVAGRGQPDARHPRVPSGHPVARDLRHAGARHHRSGRRRARKTPARPRTWRS